MAGPLGTLPSKKVTYQLTSSFCSVVVLVARAALQILTQKGRLRKVLMWGKIAQGENGLLPAMTTMVGSFSIASSDLKIIIPGVEEVMDFMEAQETKKAADISALIKEGHISGARKWFLYVKVQTRQQGICVTLITGQSNDEEDEDEDDDDGEVMDLLDFETQGLSLDDVSMI